MVSDQNIWHYNHLRLGISFGFDETLGKPFKNNKSCPQNILPSAIMAPGLLKRATLHTLHLNFSSQPNEAGSNLKFFQAFSGYSNIETARLHTQLTTKGLEKIQSRLARLVSDASMKKYEIKILKINKFRQLFTS